MRGFRVSFLFLLLSVCVAGANTAPDSGSAKAQPVWYSRPTPYYVIGGVLLVAGLGVTLGTDDCGAPENKKTFHCRNGNLAGQMLSLAGLGFLGIGLYLDGPAK